MELPNVTDWYSNKCVQGMLDGLHIHIKSKSLYNQSFFLEGEINSAPGHLITKSAHIFTVEIKIGDRGHDIFSKDIV